ncbi:U3 small nucleolar ribonucleoprotein IMP4 [Capsaspora owczarzaki ATCC 30864]|uniref:U3 small nucleolar ribonucleoprotein IMP4 n=1 Tax=Capsaspora owczarzaki (strain ATCC 30864) TaxID=595528 RepID=A0A0D2X2M0_CAPO3|nr:U3 small nucleolar ribonucleoprotein IMP4 [Capsaspora owczarzaki ATCC 30864]KJE92794.1 U3 small nucleolar ribonucleoprotein IMP4 [Capsaspora owczarzaki ATCC 30864]|eukprot:XP_004363422.1 U3 small nucleolar ribonucleoprotein IMP4 [Capsaspora owczarzaki ATCC 30864]
MLRREARERREYLYRKAVEDRERTITERKAADRLFQANPLLAHQMSVTQAAAAAVAMDEKADGPNVNEDAQGMEYQDDEYAYAGNVEPKIMLTTSRDPSSRLKMFAKELRGLLPNTQKMNRGGYILKELVAACRKNDVTDLIIVHEHRGEPDGLVISHMPYGPTAYFALSNVVMRHDLPELTTAGMPEAYPHLIFNNFNTRLGERVRNILKYLFPVPKDDSSRVITFANTDDYVSLRHHTFKKSGRDIQLTEVGPRFEMKVYQIKLGTADETEADDEWVLKPYMHTARKRTNL